MQFPSSQKAFSLVELLITLALVGILAVFTIPALFNTPNSTLSSKQTAMAKDVAFMVMSAYKQYQLANPTVPTTTGLSSLTPYMNYVSVDLSSTIDNTSGGSLVCGTGNYACLKLHNGGYLYYGTNVSFNTANTPKGFWIGFDPDGTRNNQPSLGMVLTYDSSIKTYGTLDTTYYYRTGVTDGSLSPGTPDAGWFSGF